MMDSIEVLWLVEVPGGDRRYICHSMTPERYKQLKADNKGTRIFKVVVEIPEVRGKTQDETLARGNVSVMKIPVAREVMEPPS